MFGHATRMCRMAAYRFVTGIDTMMLVHWKKTGADAPGVWAVCEAVSAEDAAEAVKGCIPAEHGYIDGIVLNYHGADDLDIVKAAVTDAVHSVRPLEMPLDILVKISDAFEAAWRFPFAER